MFLSDLLDWVLRASRDEGPRIIQDAGKDGVLRLRAGAATSSGSWCARPATIARQQRGACRTACGRPGWTAPCKVLAAQLDEAADLASLVQVEHRR